MDSEPPISSVYVRNLEERVKLEPLTEALRTVFSQFGDVVDIVAKRNVRARGQAFVVFDRPESAHRAIDEVQGFELFGKPMVVAQAQSRSDKTVEMKCNPDAFENHKRHRIAEKDKRRAMDAVYEQRQLKKVHGSGEDLRPAKAVKAFGLRPTGTSTSTVVPDEYLPPNKILFLQNIPDEYDIDGLTRVFGRFEGFREIRLVPGRRGIAFVEYEAEQGAITAKENTAGMDFGDKPIKVTYQRQ